MCSEFVCVCVCVRACVYVCVPMCVRVLCLLNLLVSELTASWRVCSAKGGWSVLKQDVSVVFQLLLGLLPTPLRPAIST